MNGTTVKKESEKIFAVRKDNLAISILVSVSLPFVIVLAVPFDIFCSNYEEFGCRLVDFIPFCFLIFLTASSLFFLVTCLLRGAAYRGVTSALVGASLMLFIQSNFMNRGIESLKGDNTYTTSVSTWALVMNAFLWVAVIAAFAFCGIYFGKRFPIVKSICVALSFVTLIPYISSSVSLAITTENLFGSNYAETPYFSTVKNLTEISSDKNVFVFCIDRFDEAFYLYSAENHPEYFSELEGFTHFDNHTSLYGRTYPSLVYMLSGVKYEGAPRKEFLNSVYDGAETFETLKDNGYKINVYTNSYYSYDNGRSLGTWCDNFIEADKDNYNVSSWPSLAFLMIKIALYRCLPYSLKSAVGAIGSQDVNKYISYNIDYPTYSLDMKKIYERVKNADFEVTDDKVFSFIHVEGCHSARYDEEWVGQIDINTVVPSEVDVSVFHSLEIVNEYIGAMKENGVYEDATIIITGDHGFAETDYGELESARLTALLVKPSGVGTGEISTSSSPVSHENLWGTIFESEGIEPDGEFAPSVFDVAGNSDSDRYFYWHKLTRSKTSYSELIYKISGDAGDFSNWSLVSVDERPGTIYK